jgi:Ca2+-binding RTX toxin-like protein
MLVSAGLLLALGGVLPASAHEFEAESEVTINASTRTVPAGGSVTFFGEVTSTVPECEPNRLVHLIRTEPDPATEVGSDTTNANGEWSVTIQVLQDSRYRARVDPKFEGVHPHRHVCKGDGSGSVSIRVTAGPPPPGNCVGTEGDDVLVGTNGPDKCHGRGGDDMIDSLGGDDINRGGPGNDDIDCGPGNDRAFGNEGVDTFSNCEKATQ